MILHPLAIAELVVEGLSIFFLLKAMIRGVKIIDKWQPASATELQLSLERQGELLSYEGKIILFLSVLSLVLLVINITGIMPGHVAGAMCGTGVIEATNGYAERAFSLKLVAIIILSIWLQIDHFNQRDKTARMTVYAARFLLLGTPFAILGGAAIVKTLFSFNTSFVTDCCAALYDVVMGDPQSPVRQSRGSTELGVFGATAALYLIAALFCAVRPNPSRLKTACPAMFALTGILFLPAALCALLQTFATYHYQVLHHHCPYCLFLPEHHLVGYPLYGTLIYGLVESLAAVVASMVRRQFPALEPISTRRIRTAGRRAVALLVVFLALTVGPVAVWRWQHGVWLSGG